MSMSSCWRFTPRLPISRELASLKGGGPAGVFSEEAGTCFGRFSSAKRRCWIWENSLVNNTSSEAMGGALA
eukprot:4486770-Amphidinium_carterae.1